MFLLFCSTCNSFFAGQFNWEQRGGQTQTSSAPGPASSSAAGRAPLCSARWVESVNGTGRCEHWQKAAGPEYTEGKKKKKQPSAGRVWYSFIWHHPLTGLSYKALIRQCFLAAWSLFVIVFNESKAFSSLLLHCIFPLYSPRVNASSWKNLNSNQKSELSVVVMTTSGVNSLGEETSGGCCLVSEDIWLLWLIWTVSHSIIMIRLRTGDSVVSLSDWGQRVLIRG